MRTVLASTNGSLNWSERAAWADDVANAAGAALTA